MPPYLRCQTFKNLPWWSILDASRRCKHASSVLDVEVGDFIPEVAWFKIVGSILQSDEKFIAEIEGVYT